MNGDEFDDGDWLENTGPFCRHWGEPGFCDEKCARCGHSCNDHEHFDDTCRECPCDKWEDK